MLASEVRTDPQSVTGGARHCRHRCAESADARRQQSSRLRRLPLPGPGARTTTVKSHSNRATRLCWVAAPRVWTLAGKIAPGSSVRHDEGPLSSSQREH